MAVCFSQGSGGFSALLLFGPLGLCQEASFFHIIAGLIPVEYVAFHQKLIIGRADSGNADAQLGR